MTSIGDENDRLYYIGIDISKEFLDVYSLVDGQYAQFTNNKTGYQALIKWSARYHIDRIVYEATGVYHRAFEAALGVAGMSLCKVNPLQARRFAQSTGTRTKTDRVDAMMLARMGVALSPDILPPPSKTMNDLKALYVARQALVKDRTAAKNRSKHMELALLKRQNKARLLQIKKQLADLDATIEAIIRQVKDLSRRLDIVLSIPGVGPTAAFALLKLTCPSLGHLNTVKPLLLQAWLPSHANQVSGADAHLSVEAERSCVRLFTCPPW